MLNDNDLENIDNLPNLELTILHLSNNRYKSQQSESLMQH